MRMLCLGCSACNTRHSVIPGRVCRFCIMMMFRSAAGGLCNPVLPFFAGGILLLTKARAYMRLRVLHKCTNCFRRGSLARRAADERPCIQRGCASNRDVQLLQAGAVQKVSPVQGEGSERPAMRERNRNYRSRRRDDDDVDADRDRARSGALHERRSRDECAPTSLPGSLLSSTTSECSECSPLCQCHLSQRLLCVFDQAWLVSCVLAFELLTA